MGWPCRVDLRGRRSSRRAPTTLGVANAVAAFEPVTMIANPGEHPPGAGRVRAAGRIAEIPLRTIVAARQRSDLAVDDAGKRVAVHFGFNAWG